MLCLFIIIFSAIVTLFLVGLVCFLIEYSTETNKNNSSIKIPFSLFKEMFQIAPDKWKIDEVYKNKIIYKYNDFYFGRLDYLKYLSFKNKLEAQKRQIRTINILKEFQEDINNFKNYY